MKKITTVLSLLFVILLTNAQTVTTVIDEDFTNGLPADWTYSWQDQTTTYTDVTGKINAAASSQKGMTDVIQLISHENASSDGVYVYPKVSIPIPDGGISGKSIVSFDFDASKNAIRSYLSFKDNNGTVMAQVMIGDEGNGDGDGVFIIKQQSIDPPMASRTTNGADGTGFIVLTGAVSAKTNLYNYKYYINTDDNTFSMAIEGKGLLASTELFFDASELGSIEFVATKGYSGTDTKFCLDNIVVQKVEDLPTEPESIDFYVSESGDDSNDGSAGSPFATIQTAVDSINTNVRAYSNWINDAYTIHIAEGTYDLYNFRVLGDVDVTFEGEGADKTIITKDKTSDAVPANRLMAAIILSRIDFNLNFRNLKIYNYGYTNNQGGLFFNNFVSTSNISVSVDNCIIDKVTTRYGTLIFAKSDISFSITNSYITNVETYFASNAFGSAIHLQAGHLELYNNTFDNVGRNHKSGTGQVLNSFGSAVMIQSLSTIPLTAKIINNTFVNDFLINAPNLRVPQATISLFANTNPSSPLELSIANNLFITDTATFVGKNSAATADSTLSNHGIYAYATNAPINWGDSSNNIMLSQVGLDATKNTVNPSFTYTSPEIDFTMDGDSPKLFTSSTGVYYVKANGTDVEGQGLYKAGLTPTTDISGATRSTTAPWIGAYEEEVATVIDGAEGAIESSVSIYPNPAEGMIFIKGDVAKVELYNISGRMVQSSTLEITGIDISGLSAGMYFVRCQNETGNLIATERIIKK